MKDLSRATDDKMKSLGVKLSDKLAIEIKVLGTTIDARFEKFNARFETSERENPVEVR